MDHVLALQISQLESSYAHMQQRNAVSVCLYKYKLQEL